MELPRNAPKKLREVFANAAHFLGVLQSNTKLLSTGGLPEEGQGVPLFLSLFNHSCDPNIFVEFIDNKFVSYIIKPVKEGEQLFIGYW